MSTRSPFAVLAALGLLAGPTLVQAQPPVAAPAAPTVVERPEPRVEQVVIEGESARIEEEHVRGEVRRIRVSPRGGARPYEIVPAQGGRDPGDGPLRGVIGQRLWSVLSF